SMATFCPNKHRVYALAMTSNTERPCPRTRENRSQSIESCRRKRVSPLLARAAGHVTWQRALMARATAKSAYDVHPSVAMVQAWVQSLPAKTGRSLKEWIQLVQNDGPSSEPDRRDWLKRQHSLGTNMASWLAERASGKGQEDDNPNASLKAAEGYVVA